MKPYLLCAASLGIFLSGCGIDKMVRDDDMKLARQKCAEYGFASGSNEFSQCMQRSVESAEQQRDYANQESLRRMQDAEKKRK